MNNADRVTLNRLVRRLKPDDPVRIVSEALLSPESLSPRVNVSNVLIALMQKPLSNSPRTIVAIWSLGQLQLSKDQQSQVVAYLTDILLDRTPHTFRSKAVRGLQVVLMLAASIALGMLTLGTVSGDLVVAATTVGSVERFANIRVEAAFSLASIGGLDAISALVEGIAVSHQPTGEAVLSVLGETLSRLEVTQESPLTEETEEKLCNLLRYSNEALSLQVIDMLSRSGGEISLDRMTHIPEFAWTDRIQMAVDCAMPQIMNRIDSQRDRKTLLRPSNHSDSEAKSLLRTVNHGGTSSTNLLRSPDEDVA